MTRPQVKVCCISTKEEAKLAIQYGTDALGLVGHMPSGPGVISDIMINKIAKSIPPPIATFLLTSETKASKIIEHYKRAYTTTIQIVDKLENQEYETLRKELPHVKLVQVIHVLNERSITQAVNKSKLADAILLDSGNPKLAVKELGGTGRVHNWELSKAIRKAIEIPVFLAGGINKDNVQQAIETVEPFGIDLCSGVRTNGKLDEQKLKAFFNAVARPNV